MAKLVDRGSSGSYFESLSDLRHIRNREHLLVDVAVIAVSGIICGCDGPTAIPRWVEHREAWLALLLALPNGIPSRDCIRRPLIVLKPEALRRPFQARIADAIPIESNDQGRLVAIDGKTCRGSHDGAKGLGALHIVSVSASDEGIALGRVATEPKSNEITAIPQLSGQIGLAGTLITIDAMGCRKGVVEQIVAGKGDCVIAVEDNQPKLLAAIQAYFFDHPESDPKDLQYRCHEARDDGHGRINERSYHLTEGPRAFAPTKGWPWVRAVGYTVRITRHADGADTDEVRYYQSSRDFSGKRFGEAIRGHWGIESMHRVMDVNFCEDDSRTRERTSGSDLSRLRRFAATLPKRHA